MSLLTTYKAVRYAGYTLEPMSRQYAAAYDLMLLPEYDALFYKGDRKLFKKRVEIFNTSLSAGKSGTGVVLLYRNIPVGFCIGVTINHRLVICIAPEHRRKGLGSIMLGLVMKKYAEAGIHDVNASTKDHNAPMQSIFDKTGRRVEGELGHVEYELSNDNSSIDVSSFGSVLSAMKTPL